jgi:hypothetical protein
MRYHRICKKSARDEHPTEVRVRGTGTVVHAAVAAIRSFSGSGVRLVG